MESGSDICGSEGYTCPFESEKLTRKKINPERELSGIPTHACLWLAVRQLALYPPNSHLSRI